MDSSLLATKLRIPPQWRHGLRRDRLAAAFVVVDRGGIDDSVRRA